jgi:hypothetical protein
MWLRGISLLSARRDERITHRHSRSRQCAKRHGGCGRIAAGRRRVPRRLAELVARTGESAVQRRIHVRVPRRDGSTCRGDPCHSQPDPPRLLSPADTEAEQTCSANSQVYQGVTHTVACRSIGPVKNSELTPCRRRVRPRYTGRYKNLILRRLVPFGFVPTAPIPLPSHPFRSMPSSRNA